MIRVLVTGANGLLGQKLVKRLASEFLLFATGRGPNRNPVEEGYTYRSADLTRKEAVEHLITEVQPELIIHCAAMTQVDACEQNPNPISIYGKSKLKVEQLVQSSLLPWSIVRTVLVYGVAFDPSRSNIVFWVKKSLEESKPIRVVDDQYRTPKLAEDLAEGCRLIAAGKHQGIYHLSGDELMTPYQIALQVADHFGLDQGLISRVDASSFTQPGKRPQKTGFNITKAKAVLGFSPHTFSQGLEIVGKQLVNI